MLRAFDSEWYASSQFAWLVNYTLYLSRTGLYEPFRLHPYAYCYNNPVNFVDPLGLWTIQIGPSFTAGCKYGVTIGFGIVFGRGKSGRWQFGGYLVSGGGAFVGGAASAMLDITWSPNDCIKDLEGPAITIGGSGGEGWGGGGEMNQPVLGGKKASYTGSIGGTIGFPVEVHAFGTMTGVCQWR
jgi:hypothetical protein